MKLGTFMFDEKCTGWTNSREFNIETLRVTERYLNEIIRYKGYIYLNEIYERFGAKWNPKDDNPCVIVNDIKRIAFIELEIFYKPNNTFLVLIHRCD